MPLYVVESYNNTIEHGGHDAHGVSGTGGGSERVFLYVIPVSDGEVARLRTRVDEDGNKQHDRLALPDRYDWWIAVDGEKVWPGTLTPKIRSRCTIDDSGVPTPAAVGDKERAELERVKAHLPR